MRLELQNFYNTNLTMKFSHFAFETLQQVRILVHIGSIFSFPQRCIVILLVLLQYKIKQTK